MSDCLPVTPADLEAARARAWRAVFRANLFVNEIRFAWQGHGVSRRAALDAVRRPFEPVEAGPGAALVRALEPLHFGGRPLRHAGLSATTAHHLAVLLLARVRRCVGAALLEAVPEGARAGWRRRFDEASVQECWDGAVQDLWDAVPVWQEAWIGVTGRARRLPRHDGERLLDLIQAEFLRAQGRLAAAPAPAVRAAVGEQMSPVTRALGLLVEWEKEGRPWKMADLAQAAGISIATLYRNRTFRAALFSSRAARRLPKGQKGRGGSLEADAGE